MSRIDTPRNKYTLHISSVSKRDPAFLKNPRDDYEILNTFWQHDIFDSGPSGYAEYRIDTDEKGEYFIARNNVTSPTSRQVFESCTILPYAALFDYRSYKKEIQLLGQRLPTPELRTPMLYRISEKWVIDDLGRIYYFKHSKYDPHPYDNRKLVWYRYSLSGDCRNTITLSNDPLPDGSKSSLSLPVYTFAGLAGYQPPIQDHFISSGKYQFHHVEENKLDIRPLSIVPLETDLHNYVHKQYTVPGKFFLRSKTFYV